MLIFGTNCNSDKAIVFALQAIYGINQSRAHNVCAIAGIHPHVKLKNLSAGRVEKLNKVCREQVPRTLQRYVQGNIQTLIQIKHYKGVRHMFGLPCRGQSTRTNARTAKALCVVKGQKAGGPPQKQLKTKGGPRAKTNTH